MLTKQDVDVLGKAEERAYMDYLEAQRNANHARKEFALQELKRLGIEFNKTHVYVRNYNDERVRAVVRAVTKSGKVTCFQVNKIGVYVSSRQAACCSVNQLQLV